MSLFSKPPPVWRNPSLDCAKLCVGVAFIRMEASEECEACCMPEMIRHVLRECPRYLSVVSAGAVVSTEHPGLLAAIFGKEFISLAFSTHKATKELVHSLRATNLNRRQ